MKRTAYMLVFLVMGLACEDDALKTPTKLQVGFSVSELPQSLNLPFSYTLSSAQMCLGSFSLEGYRQVGDDVFVKEAFSPARSIDMMAGPGAETLTYTLPQGIYEHIEIGFEMVQDTLSATLMLEGVFTTESKEEDYPFRLLADIHEHYSIDCKRPGGGNIILEKDKQSACDIVFEPYKLFTFVAIDKITEADVEIIDDEPLMILSAKQNTALYNQIVPRLDAAFQAFVE